MEARDFYNFYAKRSKKDVNNNLEISNPFNFAASYGFYGCIKFRVNEESDFFSAIAVVLHNVTNLPSNHSFFFIFRIPSDRLYDITCGDISLREAFDNFYYAKISNYDEKKIEELKNNAGIVRNGRKIIAAINNAKIFMQIQKEFGSFSKYIWGFTNGEVIKNIDDNFVTTSSLSDAVSKDLSKRGMKFVGSTIIYSYLQAIGIINDHELSCDWYNK